MQTNLYFLVRFILVLLFLSCSHPSNNSVENVVIVETVDTLSFEEVEKKIKEEQLAEIYRIDKKAVIFFMINKEDAKNLAKELGDSYRWETDWMFNGFINQTKEFTGLVRKHNIKSELVFNSKFQIILDDSTSVFFDREQEDQIMGEIITDGKKKPLIEYGMFPDKELAKLIQDFFEIENLGYLPPDTSTIPEDESFDRDSVLVELSDEGY